jgi:hypothetical protein
MTTFRVLRWVVPILALVGGFVWFILAVTIWDGSDRFGTVPVPGHQVVHLPAGTVEVYFKDHTIGSGDNDSLNVIPVQLSIRRADHDGTDPTIRRASGSLKVVNNTGHQKVAELDVASEADYEVTTGSQGGGFDPRITFGKGMSHWNIVWITLAAMIGSWFLMTLLIRATRGEQPPQRVWTPPAYTPQGGWQYAGAPSPAPATPPPAPPAEDPYARLETLGELHRSGAITDAEFETKKREILGS